jgi:2-succinyl-5-enolpyruvyl-6-hydroxy-3-cyclohexene-1-carboxylate synthase
VIGEFAATKNIPLLGDILSNLHCLTNTITLADSFIGRVDESTRKALAPDLLITFGKSTISKNLKLFLRKYKPKFHWHIQEEGHAADTFQSLTRIIPAKPVELCQSLESIAARGAAEYLEQWHNRQTITQELIADFASGQEFNEFSSVHAILENLPLACDIHLANSMPVRWANLFGLDHTKQQVEIFCNRGTSGIDGCTSTAIGSALNSDKMTLLLTGDMAFFYDRNAFWNKYLPDNLRIIVLNNHGGGIFDIIDGPSEQPEHEEYFLTEQKLSAKALAEEFGLKYYHCQSVEGLSNGLDKFWVRDGSTKILEIETDIKTNSRVFNDLKTALLEQCG